MADFTLDTSGVVDPWPFEPETPVIRWRDLSPFEQGHVEALFTDCIHLIQGDEEDGLYWVPHFSDLSPEALALIRRDCTSELAVLHETTREHFRAMPRMGAAFWRARQGNSSLGVTPHSGAKPLTISLSDEGKVVLQVAT